MDHPTSFHIWLEFTELQAERTYSRALRMGVAPTPPDAPVVDPSSASGLRLCLGAPDTVARLEEALTIVKKAMDQTSYGTHALV